jgi:hypothetical protein
VVASPGFSADVEVDVHHDLELVGLRAEVEAARRRHPSARPWQPDHLRLARRFAQVLAASGARCPDVAAAALALRSRSGLDRTAFARVLGVNDGDLHRVEAGACPVDRLPPPLADAAFFLRVLSTLRPLRLVDDGQAGAAATATGRPPVTFSRSP